MTHNTNNHNNQYPSDEIDLRALLQTLWASKWLIIAITLLVSCTMAGYAFLSTPVYQTSVHTLPPTTSSLAGYNLASQLTGDAIHSSVMDSAPGIKPLSIQDAYATFLRHLNSNTVRQKFFEAHYLPAQAANKTEGDKQAAWKRLNGALTINLPKKAGEFQASLALEGTQAHTIAEWANAYLSLAIEAANKELISGLAGEVQTRQVGLENKITALRQVAENSRRSRITRLHEMLAIAETIGLETPADGAPLIAINTQGANAESTNNGSPLYLRGAIALRAELEQLQQRESDDAYIAELPNLLIQQALLNSINLNPDLISVATIDQAAIAPEQPIKPRKPLIVLLGLVLGGMLGIFAALMLAMFRKPA